MNINNKGLLLILSTAVISGFSIFINKHSVSVINPYIFTFLKNLIVALLLTTLIFALKDWKKLKLLTKKQWTLLVLIGLIGGSIPFLLFFKGLSLTNAAAGSFIHKTMFVYVAILAIYFLKEKIDKGFLIGAMLLLAGNALLLKSSFLALNKGNLLILIAAFFWAIESVISKYALKELNGKTVAWGRMFFGSIFILAFLFAANQTHLIAILTPKQAIWTLITSAFLFGYVITWYNGLKYVPVSVAACILLLGSPITTLLNLLASGTMPIKELASASLIILGIILIIGAKKALQISSKCLDLKLPRSTD